MFQAFTIFKASVANVTESTDSGIEDLQWRRAMGKADISAVSGSGVGIPE
jgi:hypothetical protein